MAGPALVQGDEDLNQNQNQNQIQIQIQLRAAPSRVRPWRAHVAAGVMSLLLAACGGGGGSSPQPSVTIQASATSTTASGANVTLTASLANSTSAATPTWSLSGPGSLSAASGTSTTYLPPDSEVDANDVGVTAVVTVSVAGVSQTQSIHVDAKAFAGHHWSLGSAPSASWDVVTYANGLFVAGGSDGVLATSADGTTWTRHDTTGGEEWNSIVYASASGWLAYDDQNGTLLASTDGVTWAPKALPAAATGDTFTSIGYGNGVIVLLGYSGGSVSSTDGATWTKSSVTGYSIAYGSGVFVVAQSSGQMAWSADGVNWTAATQPASLLYAKVAFNNGRFVATNGTQLLVSTDGKTWTAGGTAAYDLSNAVGFESVNGTLYAPGFVTYASTDDTTWTPVTMPLQFVTSVAGSSTKVVAVSAYGGIAAGVDVAHLAVVKADSEGAVGSGIYASGHYLWTSGAGLWSSTDGSAWSQTDFAPGSGLSFARGENDTSSGIAKAPDGTIVISGAFELANGLPTTNSTAFAWSTDGVSWTFAQPTGATGNDSGAGVIVHDGTRFLSVSSTFGYVHASADGRTWSTLGKITLPSGVGITGLAYGSGRYVLVGTKGYAATSTDAVTWTAATTVASPGATSSVLHMSGVVYAAGKFVAVGSDAVAATSTDGLTWASAATPAPAPANVDIPAGLNGITVDASGEIVAVGNYGLIETSHDGVHWTVRPTGRIEQLWGVAATSTGFMVGGQYGVVLLSTN